MAVLESHGGRQTVSVQGTAEQINSAFHIVLNRYEEPLRMPSPHANPQSAAKSPAVSTLSALKVKYTFPPSLPASSLA
jgi:hypothetical protein